MIVRARAKELKDVPPTLVCCDLTRENIARSAGQVVRVDTATAYTLTLTCTRCGAKHEGRVVRVIFGDLDRYGQAYLDTLDLDEGACA